MGRVVNVTRINMKTKL